MASNIFFALPVTMALENRHEGENFNYEFKLAVPFILRHGLSLVCALAGLEPDAIRVRDLAVSPGYEDFMANLQTTNAKTQVLGFNMLISRLSNFTVEIGLELITDTSQRFLVLHRFNAPDELPDNIGLPIFSSEVPAMLGSPAPDLVPVPVVAPAIELPEQVQDEAKKVQEPPATVAEESTPAPEPDVLPEPEAVSEVKTDPESKEPSETSDVLRLRLEAVTEAGKAKRLALVTDKEAYLEKFNQTHLYLNNFLGSKTPLIKELNISWAYMKAFCSADYSTVPEHVVTSTYRAIFVDRTKALDRITQGCMSPAAPKTSLSTKQEPANAQTTKELLNSAKKMLAETPLETVALMQAVRFSVISMVHFNITKYNWDLVTYEDAFKYLTAVTKAVQEQKLLNELKETELKKNAERSARNMVDEENTHQFVKDVKSSLSEDELRRILPMTSMSIRVFQDIILGRTKAVDESTLRGMSSALDSAMQVELLRPFPSESPALSTSKVQEFKKEATPEKKVAKGLDQLASLVGRDSPYPAFDQSFVAEANSVYREKFSHHDVMNRASMIQRTYMTGNAHIAQLISPDPVELSRLTGIPEEKACLIFNQRTPNLPIDMIAFALYFKSISHLVYKQKAA